MGLYSKSGPEISSRQLIATASNGQEGCEHLQSPLGGDGMGRGGGGRQVMLSSAQCWPFVFI